MPRPGEPEETPEEQAPETPEQETPEAGERPAAGAPAERDIAGETREWLKRTGRGDMSSDVRAEAGRDVRRYAEDLRDRAGAPPVRGEPYEVSRLRETLKTGDDSRFLSELLDVAEARAERRVMGRMTQNQKNQAFGSEINEFVTVHAPELPLVVFWAYADEADRRFPGQIDRQIDWAIKAGLTAMSAHTSSMSEREASIRGNRDKAESLDGTPSRGGRGRSTEREETFVEQLRKHQDQFI